MIYRLAVLADAAAIAELILATWETSIPIDWVASIIQHPKHTVWIADDGARLAGFCASFPTLAADATPRWEIDLLAVQADLRGHGIGRSLVGRAVQTGRQRVMAVQRALVAAGNAASERCFEANGFRSDVRCELWVGPPAQRGDSAAPPPGAHLIAVETLTYQGIWVERRFDAAALVAAQCRAALEGRNTVGAVVPAGVSHDSAQLGFSRIASYRWWIREE
jgi:GNAT superfamily N-acetyltransferase